MFSTNIYNCQGTLAKAVYRVRLGQASHTALSMDQCCAAAAFVSKYALSLVVLFTIIPHIHYNIFIIWWQHKDRTVIRSLLVGELEKFKSITNEGNLIIHQNICKNKLSSIFTYSILILSITALHLLNTSAAVIVPMLPTLVMFLCSVPLAVLFNV